MRIFGILNLTPDSFSDGGKFNAAEAAVEQARQMLADGAYAIDIGAESTRPGATPISSAEEIKRLKPVLDKAQGIPLSLDTRHVATAEFALKYDNVKYLNDVSGFNDPKMVALALRSGLEIIAMHSLGIPADKNVILNQPPLITLKNWIAHKFAALTKAGIKAEKIIFDPGIGFGKSAEQSQELVNNAAELAQTCHDLGARILYGHSRKSFIKTPPEERDRATAKISAYLRTQAVDFVRVHNVKANAN